MTADANSLISGVTLAYEMEQREAYFKVATVDALLELARRVVNDDLHQTSCELAIRNLEALQLSKSAAFHARWLDERISQA